MRRETKRTGIKGKGFALAGGLVLVGFMLFSPPQKPTDASPASAAPTFDYLTEIRSLRSQVAKLQADQTELVSLRSEMSQLREASVAAAAKPAVDHSRELNELKLAIAKLEEERESAATLISELQSRLVVEQTPVQNATVQAASPEPPPGLVHPQPRPLATTPVTYRYAVYSAGDCSTGGCAPAQRRGILGWRR